MQEECPFSLSGNRTATKIGSTEPLRTKQHLSRIQKYHPYAHHIGKRQLLYPNTLLSMEAVAIATKPKRSTLVADSTRQAAPEGK